MQLFLDLLLAMTQSVVCEFQFTETSHQQIANRFIRNEIETMKRHGFFTAAIKLLCKMCRWLCLTSFPNKTVLLLYNGHCN